MKKPHVQKKYILFLTVILLSLCLGGCMEAGAEDWIGYSPADTAPSDEEETTEAVPEETVGEMDGGDKEVENNLPTYTIEEPEAIAEIEEEEEDIEEASEEEPDDDDTSVSADEIDEDDDDDGDNHDVTKGSLDGTDWSAEATIGENHGIKVSVSATKEALKQEKVKDYKPASEKMGDNISDVRFAYYTKAEGGDRDAAASDVEDFEDVDKMSDSQLKALMAVSDDIGKLVAQFGITAYDFTHPADNDDNEVLLDLYCGSKRQFIMTLEFEENNKDKLSSIDFSLEE